MINRREFIRLCATIFSLTLIGKHGLGQRTESYCKRYYTKYMLTDYAEVLGIRQLPPLRDFWPIDKVSD